MATLETASFLLIIRRNPVDDLMGEAMEQNPRMVEWMAAHEDEVHRVTKEALERP